MAGGILGGVASWAPWAGWWWPPRPCTCRPVSSCSDGSWSATPLPPHSPLPDKLSRGIADNSCPKPPSPPPPAIKPGATCAGSVAPSEFYACCAAKAQRGAYDTRRACSVGWEACMAALMAGCC